MSKYEHIIWDFNGTLMEDAWLCIEVMNEMLSRRGLKTLSPQQYGDMFDFPVEAYYQRAGWDLSRYPFSMLSDEFMAGYHARKLECKLRPEAAEVLAKAQTREVSQAIISAAQESMVTELVDHFGIGEFFTSVNGLEDHHAAGKTGIGLAWMEKAGVDPETVLFVGDTTHDMAVAQAMGVDCVLVFSGHQSHEKLIASRTTVVEHLDQIKF